MKKIVTVVGARPQFVKAAVLRRHFAASKDFNEILIHTGQHYDEKMSDIFFKEMRIDKPDYQFTLTDRSHGAMTGEMMKEIEQVLFKEKPDACLVYGDTDSTLAGALAATKMNIPVFHVEAGLRSFNRKMPEEINRVLTDHISKLLFCSTYQSIVNLKNEGITTGVHHTGDIMYDTVVDARERLGNVKLIQGIDLTDRHIAVCTIHRAENTDDTVRLAKIFDTIKSFTTKYKVVLPLHPRTRNAIARDKLSLGNIVTIDPLGYDDMQRLLSISKLVLTDSGGLQKEAYFHGVPCVTLRDETEWVELIDHGWNRLWTETKYKERKPISEYGEGQTGKIIMNLIREHLSKK